MRSRADGSPGGSSGAVSGAVWLVGMMGAGKSTVGPLLARALSRAFVDTDAEIEAAEGRSIAEIFGTEGGERRFRELERRAAEAAAGRGAVVALGGGAIAQPGAPERLRARGIVVYLRAEPEELLARVGRPETRPLLRGLGREARLERLRSLLAERAPAYDSAQVVVDVAGRGAEEIAEQVADSVRALEHRLMAPESGPEADR